jgi:site-specific DNA-methyltransferase (adenine-specific)
MQKFLNKIICGDCIELLSQADDPFADLIFADPPFNIGYKYDKYDDNVKSKSYLDWSRDWIAACKSVLKPDGSFYIAIGDKYAAELKVIATDMGLHLRNWIIWHYTFGQQAKNKFAGSHTHIFYFVNDKTNFTFNDHAARVPSDRQLLYNDKRANPLGKMPDDVWDQYSRVCGTFKERLGWHPCQMPESILKRIIAVSSNAGDCILDPFSGSGTTAAASWQMKRNYVGIEISENYAKLTRQRLDDLKKKKPMNSILSPEEWHELQRLLADMAMPAQRIIEKKQLSELFTNQFSVRMKNKKKYSVDNLMAALEEFKS